MAGKTFHNKSKNYINVTLLIRQGTNIQKPSLEQFFSLDAGETKFVEYGNATNIYLNGLVLEYKDPTTQSLTNAKEEVIATGVAPTFDWVLNTHSTITINSTNGLDISASN
ncbi:hypothetical protein H2O64_16915 [Kordia sp. YSTF-M3]|uniref:Uncharacterized protein n=1 Tax=Kordia aestuariivivens TaxID=2759037 RepID=A0ABR7QCQ7_9FLAO|nr:hypothetical protein [Kordia aestuariivivens]MBC8756359.1 hypothetical protein [Kordia aestuariivivens]